MKRVSSDSRLNQWLLLVPKSLPMNGHLAVAVCSLLSNSSILGKLRGELLVSTIPNPTFPTPLLVIERLTYRKAIVQEARRLAFRIYRSKSAHCTHEAIFSLILKDGNGRYPPGDHARSSTLILHRNENIFPDSQNFLLERWIQNLKFDKYQFTFSKSSRQ
jgi:hypothetical protein